MKKFLSVLTAFGIFLTVGCLAASSDEWKNNIGEINLTAQTVTGNGAEFSKNTVTITQGGDFTVTGTLNDGMIYVNTTDRVKLRLSGVNIINSSGPAIFFDNTDKGFITITENTVNTLTDAKEYSQGLDADAALFSNDDLEIKGDGTLYVTGNYRHGIASDDDLSIENGVIEISSYEHAIKANNKVSISGGQLTVSAETGKGIKGGKAVALDGGDIEIQKSDEGIESKGTLTINGGNIRLYADDDGLNSGNQSSTENFPDLGNWQRQPSNEEAPQIPDGTNPQHRDFPRQNPESGKMPEDKDTAPMERPAGNNRGGGMGMGRINEETAQAHAITINGGSLYINAGGDGIDSNGSLSINGGTVIIDGPSRPGNGSLDSEGTMSITSGTVITTSSAGMLQLPNGEINQNLISITLSENQPANSLVQIQDASGKELISVTAQNSFQCVIYSDAALKEQGIYSLWINGEKKEEITITEPITQVGSAGRNNVFGGFGGGWGTRFPWNKNQSSNQQNTKENTLTDEISVIVNGNRLNFSQKPVIKDDTTLVPLRTIFEALGAQVSWDEATRTVSAKKDDTVITLQIGNRSASRNGDSFELLIAPEIIGDSTMVPVRFISESLGLLVEWDEASRTIKIS